MNGKTPLNSGGASVDLYITHLDHVGPYLKLYGQANRDAAFLVSTRIETLLPTCFAIDPSWSNERQQALLTPGTFCVFKRTNGAAPGDVEYMRTRVLSAGLDDKHLNNRSQMRVEIEFLDYGYKRNVSSRDLLFSKQPQLLQNIPVLCSQYIVLGICSEWDQSELDTVKQLMVNHVVSIKVDSTQICGQKFASVRWKDFELNEFLVQQKQIGAPIANELIMDHCKKLWKAAPPSPVIEYNNNNIQSTGGSPKTPTDVAREQIAARYSLAARLDVHRTLATTSPRPLKTTNDYTQPKQQQQQLVQVQPPAKISLPTPLANLTNVLPNIVQVAPTHPVNAQKAAYAAVSHPYNQHSANNQTSKSSSGLLPAHNVFAPKTSPRPLNMYYNVRLNNPMQPQPLLQQPALNFVPIPRYALGQPPAVAAAAAQKQQQQLQPIVPAFRTTSLTVGLTYDVYVSFVENGPHLFWVQLKSANGDLNAMMSRIERIRLQTLTQFPGVGTACVARFSEDGNFYRALVSAVYGQRFRVVYVDYGNSELVTLADLYQIPEELLLIKPFAFRFALAGAKELGALDESMKRIFKNSALYINFQLTVQAAESVGSIQTCHLMHNNNSMLEVLKKLKNSRQAYAKAEQLQNDDAVEIRYIDSPSNFYVQKVNNIEQFEQLMDEMFAYYNINQLVPEQLVLGAPCVVKCDREWYRAELLRVDDTTIIVRHVDFGYEQHVKRHLIGNIAEKHLLMPRQAIKCCLKGFENSELSQDKITDQFEMLAEESNIRRRTFSVRVFRIEPDGLNVVNLMAKNLNVMKKLYKLSMPFEQYLSLEKGQFNANVTRAESIASDALPQQLEKGQVLNSTTVESEDRMQLQKQKKTNNVNANAHANTNANEWDKHSSASTSSKDTQSQQSGAKRQLQQARVERNGPDGNLMRRSRDIRPDTSFESRSTSSYTSGMSSPRKGNRQNGRNRTDSPRLQNGKMETNKNSRLSNTQSPRKDAQQMQQSQRNSPNQRSLNAPQGFAQKPQRQKSTLDGTASSSKRSSGVESDATSNAEAASPKPLPEPEKYVPLDKAFALHDIKTPSKEAASLSWWVSPFQFYVVPKSIAAKYESVLRELRQFYRQKPHQPLQLKVGSSVVVRQRKDNAILRGTVVACNHMLRKYRIFCVDAGKLLTVTSEDVWQLEQRFAEVPCLAQRCSFDRVVTNYDHLYIVDRMEKFVPANAKVECEFRSKQPPAQQQLQQHNNNNSWGTYIVKMLVNGASLRDTLINAQFLTEVAEPVRVGLLAGQQVRGKFTSIRDMTNFKIQLESCSDVNFLCSYDDAKFVKSNKELAKPFKEHYEGKSYALNIKHVCENNIIHLRPVMPLFKEERSAYICGYPVLVSSFQALVVYIAKSYRIFVQPSSVEPAMKKLLDDMYAYYSKKGKQLRKFEKDQVCAALSSDGNWYRARILAKEARSARMDVLYIDYGNTEQLPREQLKQLEEKFYVNKSCYAVEVNLPFGRINNDEQLKARLAKLLEEQVVTVKPVETRRNHLIADVLLPNGSDSVLETLKAEKLIAGRDIDYMRKQLDKEKPHIYEYIECVDLTTDDDEELQQRKSKSNSANSSPKAKKEPKEPKESNKRNKQVEQAAPVAAAAPVPAASKAEVKTIEPTPIATVPEPVEAVEPPTAPVSEEIAPAVTPPPITIVPITTPTPTPDPYKDMERAVLSHCDNPAHFYVHPLDAVPKLKRLTENLQIVSPSLPQLLEIVNGADCISMYSMDKSWYRAKILDAELMVLQFIDFGNTDCVSDAKEIKQSMCSQLEPFCLPFALPIAPNGKLDWADAANGIFNDSYEKILHYEYLTQGDCYTLSYVNLFIEGIDVAKKLVSDGFAKPLDYVSSGSSCYISHVNSIADFYIQLECDSKALELIELYLGDAEQQLEPLQRFEKGSIVAALFDDDGLFYRAELLRQLPDARYEVRFIDYGNTSSTSKCLLLSEQIASAPSLSKRCALQLPEDYVGWSQEAEAKFAELTGEGELVFTTQLLKPGLENIIIHLMLDEDNVLDQLLPLCKRKQPKPQEQPQIDEKSETESGSANVMAIVTHVNSPSSFYLQFEADNVYVDNTSELLNGESSKLQPKQQVAQVGELCVAQFADDNEFYRARILEQLPAKQLLQYRVLFIDFGNQALVDKLFELPAELAQLKPLAELHALESCANFIKYPKESREALDALIDSCNGEVAVEFVNKSAQPPVVRLKTMDKQALNIHEQLQKLLEAELLKPQAQANNKECIISHGSSPKSFYVQLKKNSAQLDLIVKTLQGVSSEQLQPLTSPAEQLNGVCYSQEDDCYYRCCIKQLLAEDKGCEVFLIDYGGSLITSQVYLLPDLIWQIPPLALHCQLSEIPQDVPEAKLEEAFTALLEQHFGEVYELVNEPNEDTKELQAVQLRINYKDFAQELASTVAGVQQPLEVELYNCIVVQYDNAKSFYVQMEQDVPALEQMTDKMLDAEQNFEIFTELQVGALCVAKFPEDEVFYRAEIVKLLDAGKCEVHFIDFGNNAVTDQFRQLPEELAKAPRYSKHCELESATIAKCDVAALGAFIDTRFSETFQLEILATKEERNTHVVRLFYQNTNISEQLRLQNQP
ncbi:maternal protein tudor [Drosophila novamexicana]|uniref:maternal protein tudor n=1 Tax=Drosophila novamexicana TaxID=47314 RepID=UPI0011E5C1D4|nr:maternal protein tudor [Drosophila novamexicana]